MLPLRPSSSTQASFDKLYRLCRQALGGDRTRSSHMAVAQWAVGISLKIEMTTQQKKREQRTASLSHVLFLLRPRSPRLGFSNCHGSELFSRRVLSLLSERIKRRLSQRQLLSVTVILVPQRTAADELKNVCSTLQCQTVGGCRRCRVSLVH